MNGRWSGGGGRANRHGGGWVMMLMNDGKWTTDSDGEEANFCCWASPFHPPSPFHIYICPHQCRCCWFVIFVCWLIASFLPPPFLLWCFIDGGSFRMYCCRFVVDIIIMPLPTSLTLPSSNISFVPASSRPSLPTRHVVRRIPPIGCGGLVGLLLLLSAS